MKKQIIILGMFEDSCDNNIELVISPTYAISL